jgi:hypothetical protein
MDARARSSARWSAASIEEARRGRADPAAEDRRHREPDLLPGQWAWIPEVWIGAELQLAPGSAPGKTLSMITEWVYAVIMMRTQISLTPDEMRAARAEAKRLGISLAELLRRSLRTLLPAESSKPWMRYAGMIEFGDTMSSQRIDDVIYGQKD